MTQRTGGDPKELVKVIGEMLEGWEVERTVNSMRVIVWDKPAGIDSMGAPMLTIAPTVTPPEEGSEKKK
jgi:hypothetical protein